MTLRITSLFFIVVLILSAAVVTSNTFNLGVPCPSCGGTSIDVTNSMFGTNTCLNNSGHDDAAAIQAAIDYASANNIPTVTVNAANPTTPTTCYLLTSRVYNGPGNGSIGCCNASAHIFPQNGVTLQGNRSGGTNFTNFISTDNVFDLDYGYFSMISWGRMGCHNAGPPTGLCTFYYPMNPITGSSTPNPSISTTVATGFPVNANDIIVITCFHPANQDDYGAQDRCWWITKVQTVTGNCQSGPCTITTQDPITQNFSTPFLGDLTWGLTCACSNTSGTSVDTFNVTMIQNAGVKNINWTGTNRLLTITEVYNVVLQNNVFNYTTQISAAQIQWNSLEHTLFDNNSFFVTANSNSVTPPEGPQRSSGFLTMTNNTFWDSSGTAPSNWGFSENPYKITFSGNHVFLTAPGGGIVTDGFDIGAWDATISNNDIHGSGGSYSQCCGGFVVDSAGTLSWYGNETWTGNTIIGNAGSNPLFLWTGAVHNGLTPGIPLTFLGNTLQTAAGGSNAILFQSASVCGNCIFGAPGNGNTFIGSGGPAMLYNASSDSGWKVQNNIFNGNGSTALQVGANGGSNCNISGNNASGGTWTTKYAFTSAGSCTQTPPNL